MEHRKLASTDLQLPVVTFGAWAIGGLFWGGGDDAAAIRAIHAAIDHGIDAIDTAPIYGCGHSETLVGRAIRGRRERVKILTKCGLLWGDAPGEFFFEVKAPDGRAVKGYKNVKADSILRECEQSLARLGVETIDLYQVHWPSDTAAAEETIGALRRLVEQGKIRHIGVSNYSAAQLAEAARFAPVVSNQIEYSLLKRQIESDPLPYCRQNNVGVLAYSPMAMGLLTGKVTMDRQFDEADLRHELRWFQPQNRSRVVAALEQVRPIADAHGATLAQLSVAWVIAQAGITTALVGARNAHQAAENAGAAEVKLSPAEQTALRRTFEALGEPLE